MAEVSMSRNAVAAMAVVFVSGFAGCAATSRAETPAPIVTPAPVEHRIAVATEVKQAPVAQARIAVYVSAAGGG
jgi:hypothetical protein